MGPAKNGRTGCDRADSGYRSSVGLPGTATSFTVPTVFSSGNSLAQNHFYAFDIGLVETRGNAPIAGQPSVLSESRSFFDFVPLPANAPPNVYLPTVIPGPVPVYQFHTAVVGNQQIFIDPQVAIGYDYAIGQGDPNFASVMLPTGIQTGPFGLYLFNGTDWIFDTTLTGGQAFSFDAGGVDRFRILGIDPSLGLDPNNSTAFITGLTFEGNGQFTGTMTPITTSVPEPATMLLLFIGLIGAASVRKLQSSH